MQHNNILVFDIETIPDAEAAKRLLNLSDDISDDDAILALNDYHLELTQGRNSFTRQLFHKVAAVSVLHAKIHRDNDLESYEIKSLSSIGSSDSSEKEIIEKFFAGCEKLKPRFITFNGRTFDLPVMRYRAMMYKIQPKWFYDMGDKWNSYTQRYSTDWHCDLLDVLNDFGASAGVKMKEVAALLNIPCKIEGSGDDVLSMYQRGELEQIRTYCETDVINTYLIYLYTMLHRGKMDRHSFDQAIVDMKGFVSGKSYATDFDFVC